VSNNLERIFKKLGIPEKYNKTSGLDGYEPDSITFLASPKFIEYVKPYMGALILVKEELFDLVKNIKGNIYVKAENPLGVFLQIHNEMNKAKSNLNINQKKPIHETVVLGNNFEIGPGTKIMPGCVLGNNVKLGENTVVFPNTVIYDDVVIGKNCKIGPNVVVGEEGFRIIKNRDNKLERMKHTGSVIIGDFIEIDSFSSINRGTFKDRVIRNHVKINSNVHIAHNVVIEENCTICASSCIGGSTKIGKECWIGIGSTLSNGIKIGNNVKIDINSVVVKDVPDNFHIAGFYARDKWSWFMKEKDEIRKYKSEKNE